jgi:hypothetical protein
MVLINNNWRIWLAGLAASLLVFGVIYFAALKPSSDTATQAAKAGSQQTQQALKQVTTALGSGVPNGSAVPSSTASNLQVHSAAALAQCLAAAGGNPTAVQACHTNYTK